ncbi:hypothetical protein Vretifemale_15912 [Volvox reticuliferus]|uniref:Uncharacterized protein n=1 Tax=Volvox reticuliferus TaxID=1737510 RepID=A0A8J4FVQ2_9CHLO|nr:hypothetical protein Vretifemale_15912 [Volvox reticuliferus]
MNASSYSNMILSSKQKFGMICKCQSPSTCTTGQEQLAGKSTSTVDLRSSSAATATDLNLYSLKTQTAAVEMLDPKDVAPRADAFLLDVEAAEDPERQPREVRAALVDRESPGARSFLSDEVIPPLWRQVQQPGHQPRPGRQTFAATQLQQQQQQQQLQQQQLQQQQLQQQGVLISELEVRQGVFVRWFGPV